MDEGDGRCKDVLLVCCMEYGRALVLVGDESLLAVLREQDTLEINTSMFSLLHWDDDSV
jgi:hypothetical protein